MWCGCEQVGTVFPQLNVGPQPITHYKPPPTLQIEMLPPDLRILRKIAYVLPPDLRILRGTAYILLPRPVATTKKAYILPPDLWIPCNKCIHAATRLADTM